MSNLLDGFDPGSGYDFDKAEETDIFLSQTTVNNATLCGGRVLYANTEGFLTEPSEAMAWGTLVHALVEAELHTLVANGKQGAPHHWTWEEIEALWVQTMEEERGGPVDLYALADERVIRNGCKEAYAALMQWHAQVLPMLPDPEESWRIEDRVTKSIGVIEDVEAMMDSQIAVGTLGPTEFKVVWLGGTADLVADGTVYDWKTAGRGWHESKADSLLQASIYSYLYEIHDHEYWVYDRKAMHWERHRTSRTQAHVDAALKQTWMVAKGMAAGALAFNPWQSTFGKMKRAWYCSAKFCPAWNVCEMKAISDNVWEEQVADPKEGWIS